VSVFAKSAAFYDALYDDKDYAAEADYVHDLVQRYRPGARSLLDLGCGTGRHAVAFAAKGYTVLGVDRSADMLEQAKARHAKLAAGVRDEIEFRQSDICDLSVAKRFDAVAALFHVMSYQISNADVIAALSSARKRSVEDGVLVFDCWYGPGVLTDPPVGRVKRVILGGHRIARVAEPVMHSDQNTVDVNYQFFVCDDAGAYAEFCETHTMRYFSIPELQLLLRQTGWELLGFWEWMTDRRPANGTWSVTVVAQAS
jgi:SAM-dependent methyltransferase